MTTRGEAAKMRQMILDNVINEWMSISELCAFLYGRDRYGRCAEPGAEFRIRRYCLMLAEEGRLEHERRPGRGNPTHHFKKIDPLIHKQGNA